MEPMTPQIVWNWPETAIEIGVLLVVAFVIYRLISYAINVVVKQSVRRAEERYANEDSRAARILASVTGMSFKRHQARTKTLGSVLRSVNAVVVLTVTVMMILRALGIPKEMFTVMFSIGRMPGWIAQWHEDSKITKIARPRQIYTGETLRSYVPITER